MAIQNEKEINEIYKRVIESGGELAAADKESLISYAKDYISDDGKIKEEKKADINKENIAALTNLRKLLVEVENTYEEGQELEPSIKKLQRHIAVQTGTSTSNIRGRQSASSQSAKVPAGVERQVKVSEGRDVAPDAAAKQNMGVVIGSLHKELGIEKEVTDSREKNVADSSGDETDSLSSDASNDAKQYDLDPKVFGRINSAIDNNNHGDIKKEDLAQLFAKGNPDVVMDVAVKIHQKANGLAVPSASHEGLDSKGDDKVFFALKLLLTDPKSDHDAVRGYKDVRSNDWLTNLGSRKFLIGFYEGNKDNKDRFTKVFQGKDIEGLNRGSLFNDLVEGCASTNKSGGSRAGTFVFFGGSSLSKKDNESMEAIKGIVAGPPSTGPGYGK